MKNVIKLIAVLAIVAIFCVSCQPTTVETISMYKPSKYQLTADGDKSIKVNITFIGRINEIGAYNETDPQRNTIEATTPWEYAMMTCKDFTYFLYVENVDTISANLTGKIVIDDVTVAEQSGEWIDMQLEY